jgi:hypothetical protein
MILFHALLRASFCVFPQNSTARGGNAVATAFFHRCLESNSSGSVCHCSNCKFRDLYCTSGSGIDFAQIGTWPRFQNCIASANRQSPSAIIFRASFGLAYHDGLNASVVHGSFAGCRAWLRSLCAAQYPRLLSSVIAICLIKQGRESSLDKSPTRYRSFGDSCRNHIPLD